MGRPSLPTRPSQDVTKIDAAWISRLLDCVVYAMDYPQGDNKTLRRNGDFLETIPQGGGGSSAIGESYDGPFKVIDSSDDASGPMIMVYDASDIDSDYAGQINLNGTFFQLEYDFLVIDSSGYVYVDSLWDDVDDKPGVPTLEFSAAYPKSEPDTFRRILAKIVYDAETETFAIYQYQYGPIEGYIWGTCS